MMPNNTFINISSSSALAQIRRSPSESRGLNPSLTSRLYRSSFEQGYTLRFMNVAAYLTESNACRLREMLETGSFDYLLIHRDKDGVPNGKVTVNFRSLEAATAVIEMSKNSMCPTVHWAPCQGLQENVELFFALQKRAGTENVNPSHLPLYFDKSDRPVLLASTKTPRLGRSGNLAAEKIFIGGVKDCLTVRDLRTHFSRFGVIADCGIVKDFHGRSRGFGFCKFVNLAASSACLANREHIIRGCRVGVRAYVLREDASPRLA